MIPTTPRVFISYRAQDAGETASGLFRELARVFGGDAVFLDHQRIDGGTNWPERLRSEVCHASVVLVLVGVRWLTMQDPVTGERRLDVQEDWVRCEIEHAIQNGRSIIPVLIDDARPITSHDLRAIPSIATFADLQATRLRRKDWDADFDSLVKLVEKHGVKRSVTVPNEGLSNPPSAPHLAGGASPDDWSDSFPNPTIDEPVNLAAESQVNLLKSRLEAVLRSSGFQPRTLDRVSVIAGELLSNVMRHAKKNHARVAMTCMSAPLRWVQLAVADDGDGFDLGAALTDLRARMHAGDREHGLLRVLRYSSSVESFRMDHLHVIVVDVYERERPSSPFFEMPGVAPVMLQYESPKVLWLGDQFHAGHSIFWRINQMVEAENRPLLDCYLGHLSDMDPTCLGVEVRGHKVETETPPYSLPTLQAALEVHFHDLFTSGRVVFLAADTEAFMRRSVSEWAKKWDLAVCLKDDGARKAVKSLRPGRG